MNDKESRVSGLILWNCQDCKRPGSLTLPLITLPDGTALCQDCQQRRQRSHKSKSLMEEKDPGNERPPAPPGSLYQAAGVPLDASTQEIKDALKAQMKYWGARQSGDEGVKAAEMLAKLRKASQVLTDGSRREKYDAELHQQMRLLREEVSERTIPLLEDWPGLQVANLKDLVRACESSSANWRIGEDLLTSKMLVRWVRWGLTDDDTVRLIERVVARQDLSVFRKLNELLYQFDPKRPFRFFSNVNAFEKVDDKKSVTNVASLIEFADAHWELAVQHLYRGELITWLDQSIAPTGQYLGQEYHNARQFFKEICETFAGSKLEGVGLEALLEFLDPLLAHPAITVTCDTQQSAYTLQDWDEELSHQPVVLSIKNTTRGCFAGTVELRPPEKKYATLFPWVDFGYLPLAPQPGQPRPTMAPQTFTLVGKREQRFTLYLGHFKGLSRGRQYVRPLEMRRYVREPAQPAPFASFPITLRLMRFRAGYRGKLWERGLRGSLPGLLLDGGLGFVAGLLIFWLGSLFTPQGSWGFFQDFTGNFSWQTVVDGLLVALLRSFYLAIAVFGFALPCVLGIWFALCGLFTGWRQGHTVFTASRDIQRHRVSGRWLIVCLWAVAAAAILLALHPEAYISLLEASFPGKIQLLRAIGFFYSNLGDAPVESPFFDAATVLVPGIFAFITTRIIVAVRRRLYALTEKRWDDLLKPAGRG